MRTVYTSSREGIDGIVSAAVVERERKHSGLLAWCCDKDLVMTCGGNLLMRLSPITLVAFSSFASRRLSAAKASRGESVGGTSPSKCCMRGEGWPVREVPAELAARELDAEISI